MRADRHKGCAKEVRSMCSVASVCLREYDALCFFAILEATSRVFDDGAQMISANYIKYVATGAAAPLAQCVLQAQDV